ncbi:MAG: ZIP family metal transporter [Bacteroidota bacterium]
MGLLHYLLLIIAVLAGGLLGFATKQFDRSKLQLVLSFSGAYVLGITVLHLMPGIYSGHEANASIGLWVLLGFVLQLLLETLSSGVEHGHIHHSNHLKRGTLISIMVGLCIHAFLEGLPLDGYIEMQDDLHGHSHDDEHGPMHFLYGIILHKAPAAFALVVLLTLSNISRKVAIICLSIFALMSPLGAWLASQIDISLAHTRILLAIVVGSFLHIATTILFEVDNTSHHRISWIKLLAIAGGLGISILTMH